MYSKGRSMNRSPSPRTKRYLQKKEMERKQQEEKQNQDAFNDFIQSTTSSTQNSFIYSTSKKRKNTKKPSPNLFSSIKDSPTKTHSVDSKKQNDDAFNDFIQSQNNSSYISLRTRKRKNIKPSPNLSTNSSPISIGSNNKKQNEDDNDDASFDSFIRNSTTQNINYSFIKKRTKSNTFLSSSQNSSLLSSSDDDDDFSSRRRKKHCSSITPIRENNYVNLYGNSFSMRNKQSASIRSNNSNNSNKLFTPKERIKEETCFSSSDNDDIQAKKSSSQKKAITATIIKSFKRNRMVMSDSSDSDNDNVKSSSAPGSAVSSLHHHKTPSSSRIVSSAGNINNAMSDNTNLHRKRNILNTLNEVEPYDESKTHATTVNNLNTANKVKSINRRRRMIMSDSSDSDDDDKAEQYLASKKSQEEGQQQSKNSTIPSKVLSSSTIKKPIKNRHSIFDFSDDSDNDNDNIIVKNENDNEITPKIETKIRNPISLFKKQNIKIEDSVLSSAARTTTPAFDDTIWDDDISDDDEIPNKEEEKEKSSTRKNAIASNGPSKTNTRKKQTASKKEKKDSGSNGFYDNLLNMPMDDDDDDNEENNDSSELLTKLKPEFANPKFGPFALMPLELIFEKAKEEVDTKPKLISDGAIEQEEKKEKETDNIIKCNVPASINRYLMEYQRVGIKFLYSKLMERNGAILGDDMGLGKTIQIISLLAALFGKTGTKKDESDIRLRQREIHMELFEARKKAEHNLLVGGEITKSESEPMVHRKHGIKSKWCPVLLIVPPTVKTNWRNELDEWGSFSVSLYNEKNKRQEELQKVRDGLNEIMICGRSLLSRCKGDIITIPWKLIIVDEFHEFKNEKTNNYKALYDIKELSDCPVIGLTGTLFQNKHKELFNLVSMCQPGLLGDWEQFMQHFEKPLKNARSKDARNAMLEMGKERQKELFEIMKEVYIHRKKTEVLKDCMTEKKEKVIFCPLSDVQKRLYQHVLNLPEFHLLKQANVPCDCGVNKSLFKAYEKLRTPREKKNFLKRNKERIRKRKQCCYQIPLNMKKDDPGEPLIDPNAALWKAFHPGDQECDGKRCPTCILLPAMHKLFKITSHASLLQVRDSPAMFKEGTASQEKAKRDLDFAKVALTPDILADLPGKSYYRDDSIMDDQTTLSGKIQVLDQILKDFQRKQHRALLFSFSTLTLTLIEHFCRQRGYTTLRLDGQTDSNKRQALVEKFQSNPSIFLFLISTTAGGIGLNLTEANKVIVFDVNWNPSCDEQAQDRAYRIGQKKDVEVIRLISRGTIEEIKYMRQIYKVNLRFQALAPDEEQNRLFSGIEGDQNRKGELFGMENLLKFKDGAFMTDLVHSARSSLDNITDTNKIVALGKDKLMQIVNEIDEDEISGENENFETGLEQFRHADILCGGSKHNTNAWNNKSNVDEEQNDDMGALTQLIVDECELACKSPKKRTSKKRGVLMGKTLEELQQNAPSTYLILPKYLEESEGHSLCDLFETKKT